MLKVYPRQKGIKKWQFCTLKSLDLPTKKPNRAQHPSLEIEITLQCVQRKNRTNPMNLWQKPMSSYKENFFLGVWPFLQIRAK